MLSHILKNILPPVIIFIIITTSFNKYVKKDYPNGNDFNFKLIDNTYDSIIFTLDSYIEQGLKNNMFPGAAVTIVKDNYVLFRKCYGVKEYGKKDSVNLHTVFRMGSVSKSFASVLTGVLVNEKVLNWDDTIKNVLPGFDIQNDEYEKQITIRHLLSHTTGLPVHAYTVLLDENVPYEQIKPLLCSIPSIGPPGRYYSYQNVVYSLIADVMESKTSEDYSTLLKKKLFDPLRMTDASSDYRSMLKNKNVAKPHVKLRNGNWLPEKHNKRYYSVAPAAGVNASIYDMTNWIKAMLGNRPETIDSILLNEIFKPHIQSYIKWKFKRNWKKLDKVYYGLGWRIFDYNNKTIIFHSGYVRGYKAEIALIPEEKTGIAILSNGATYFISSCIPRFIDDFLYVSSKNL